MTARLVGRRLFATRSVSEEFKGNMYQLIGGEPSPYTGKVRSYLIHKRIKFERVQATLEIYSGFIKPQVGWTVIPVLVAPNRDVIQDSTDIINYLEKRHPEPSIIPEGPRQRIAAKLLELLADEWLVQPAMHYRWAFPESMSFIKQEFGRMIMPKESHESQRHIAESGYGKFKGMLPGLGITEKTGPEIERSWKRLMYELSEHFDKHPYLLGGRPCIGDFAFGGMIYAHLFRDPVPGFLMKTTAPVLSAWCEHMNGILPEANRSNIHTLENGFPVRENHDSSVTDFCENDEIPESLMPILKHMMSEFAPILLSTKINLMDYIKNNVTSENRKLPRLIGTHQYTIGDVTESRSINPFNIWMWQQVTDTYQSLSKDEKSSVDSWLSSLPHGQDIVAADLSHCRVAREKNFLHVDPSSFTMSKL
uniref:uncharacterized protein LOC120328793 n=1 Tax=Styela clava TaxID=7725 RepID=UPI00193A757C|nr:uncharacterized protein LOC120328793 [Styela clava]XP_039251270.1 uncharacterized protein LOC120328793 [Styela clava]